MFSTHSPPFSVRVLVSLVSIDYLRRILDLIVILQVSQPANVVFSGIAVLLLVNIILNLSAQALMTLAFF